MHGANLVRLGGDRGSFKDPGQSTKTTTLLLTCLLLGDRCVTGG